MQKYINQWRERIATHLNKLWVAEGEESQLQPGDLVVEIPPDPSLGDIAFPLFLFAKKLKTSPLVIAERLSQLLAQEANDLGGSLKAVGPYLNISFKRSHIFKEVIQSACSFGQAYGTNNSLAGQRIMVEFSCPNTNKPLHLGHLRNDALGMSVSQILAKCGADVLRVNLINDRGIHICKSMLAYKLYGQGLTPETTGQKGDHLVGDFYVRFAKEAKTRPELEDEARALLKAWEEGEPEVRKLWAQMNGWAIDGIKKTYAETGVVFDRYYFESETYSLGREEVLKGLAQGVFFKKEDNSIWADLTAYGLDQKVLLRADGTSLYLTQDIGTAIMRARDWPFDRLIYVVGSEQKYHFRVLFLVLKLLGYPWADQLYHLAYGMVNLPEGKMKSREGTVVDADDLLQELCSYAEEEIKSRSEQPVVDVKATAKAIALAALNYYLLAVSPHKDIVFNPQESISFTGNTGPYLQYTGARISSIIRKFRERQNEFQDLEPDYSLLQVPDEWELIKRIADFPHTVAKAAEELDPSRLATLIYEAAKIFASYYHENQVLGNANKTLVVTRLSLLQAFLAMLQSGFKLLGIPFLEAM